MLYFAREAGYNNLMGIEYSQGQLQIARNLGIQNIEEGDIIDVMSRMDEASQDCIIIFDVLEHFTKEESVLIVDDISRLLKKDGRLIIHTPNGDSPFFGRMRYGDITHETTFTKKSIAQLLLASRFSSVQSFEDEPIPHGVKSTIRWFLWKIIRNILVLYLAIETGNLEKNAIFSQNFLTIAYK
jgi:SAM-dependent methyltransferase